jgi:hypothetical protein
MTTKILSHFIDKHRDHLDCPELKKLYQRAAVARTIAGVIEIGNGLFDCGFEVRQSQKRFVRLVIANIVAFNTQKITIN